MASDSHDLKITYRDRTLDLTLPVDATISDLATRCADEIGAEASKVSLFIMPKPGFVKSPFPDRKLSEILTPTTRIKLVGTPTKDVQRIEELGAKAQAAATARRSVHRATAATPSRHRDWRKIQDESTYTFHAIEPLAYLPNPEKSRRFLERLAADPGIKASMRKHKFTVGLLTEMNPAEHTTHESRTLGLNRNRGEVIELRLRTDRYDGYRDYKVIRKTLCHELSHNVWGDHDRNFWDLTKEIEREVERNDYLHGGHTVGRDEFYDPGDSYDDEELADHGGWVGGEFVLGKSEGASAGGGGEQEAGLSRREIMARAALSRMEKQIQVQKEMKKEEDEKEKRGEE